MTALLEPEADQLADAQARRLLELAGEYVRGALQVPEQLDNLRTLAAEALLEVAMLRLDVQRLSERIEALERCR